MPRILVVATTTGYQVRSFHDAAERLGLDLLFATDRCATLDDPWRDAAVPVRFHKERASVAAIVAASQARPVDGVVSVGDRPTVMAACAARRLGLPWHSPESTRVARNKQLTRQALQDAGLPTPWFRTLALDGDPTELGRDLPYPCVIKPLALSGSRGVIRVDNTDEFTVGFLRIRRLLTQKDVRSLRDVALDAIVVEGFIAGAEVAVEAILEHGVPRVLAIFDKPDPLDGPFFEETIYVTPSRLDGAARVEVTRSVAAAADSLGLSHGPLHAECRVGPTGVFVLEVAARPIGGLCARALRFASPDCGAISFEELLLRHAMGESLDDFAREQQASGVMMIPIPRAGRFRGVAGIDEARTLPGIDDVVITAKDDQRLVPLPEGSSYLGFIFARADAPDAVEDTLRRAHARLQVSLDPVLPVT